MPVVEVPETATCTTTLEDIGGLRLPTFGLPPGTIAKVMAELPDFEIRENDVLISTYLKSGMEYLITKATFINFFTLLFNLNFRN